MKKFSKPVIFAFIILVLLFLIFFVFRLNRNYVEIKTQNDLIRLKVEVADSNKEREVGLMNRKYLCDYCGMLFVFDEVGEHKFWMKNTLIGLDMIFVDKNFNIVFIERDAKPCSVEPCEVYPKEEIGFKYVIEVNGGFSERNKIYIGDRVLF